MAKTLESVLAMVKREPAILLSLFTAAVSIAAAFGFDLTAEQTGALAAFVALVVGFLTRQSVTPNVSVAARVDDTPPPGLVAGAAATQVEGTPVEIVAEGTTGPPLNERGEAFGGWLVTAAAVVIIVVGVIWLLDRLI